MWFLIFWGTTSILTALFFIFLVIDSYKRILKYYNNLGIKCPQKKFTVGSKFANLIKNIFVITCPILHFLFLGAFVFAYEDICEKTVNSYIMSHKKDEFELLVLLKKEKENEY